MNKNCELFTVQMKWKIEDYKDRQAFEKKIRSIMEKVRSLSCGNAEGLVAFPEHIGAPLVFLNTYEKIKSEISLDGAVRKLIKLYFLKILKYKIKYRVGWFRGLALSRAKVMGETYFNVFSKIAVEYGVTIVAGTALLPDFQLNSDINKIDYRIKDGNVYNGCYIFDPDGKLMGVQKKVFLVPDLEDKKGFDLSSSSLEKLKVFDTPLGKIGIAVCLDCFYEPVIDALSQMGAEILIQPSANSKKWDKLQQLDWLNSSWRAMKEHPNSFKFALNPMMIGCLFDLCFEGQSCILTNTHHTIVNLGYKDIGTEEGFARVTDDPTQEEILVLRNS